MSIASHIMIAVGACLFLVSFIISLLMISSIKEENKRFLHTLYSLGFTRESIAKSIFGYIVLILTLALIVSLIVGLVALLICSKMSVVRVNIKFVAYKLTLAPIAMLCGLSISMIILTVIASYLAANTIIRSTYDRY